MTFQVLIDTDCSPTDKDFGKAPTAVSIKRAYANREKVCSPSLRGELDAHYLGDHDLHPLATCLACRHPDLLDA